MESGKTAMNPAESNQNPTVEEPGKRSATPWSRRIIAGVLVVAMMVTLGDGLGLIGLPAGGLTSIFVDYYMSGNHWYLYLPEWLR